MDEGAPDLSNFSGSGGAIGFVAQRCSDRGDALDKFLVARSQYLRKKKKEKSNVWRQTFIDQLLYTGQLACTLLVLDV